MQLITDDPPEVRNTGRTTRQIKMAPPKSLMICWSYELARQLKEAARRLGREDVDFVGRRALESRWQLSGVIAGRNYNALIIEHSCKLSTSDWDMVSQATENLHLPIITRIPDEMAAEHISDAAPGVPVEQWKKDRLKGERVTIAVDEHKGTISCVLKGDGISEWKEIGLDEAIEKARAIKERMQPKAHRTSDEGDAA